MAPVTIYDNLFASKLSGEWRLDRPFQGRLQSKPKRANENRNGCRVSGRGLHFHEYLLHPTSASSQK